MCGRLNVVDDPLSMIVSNQLGVQFASPTNTDLKPSQTIACIAKSANQLTQINLTWGIKPDWSNTLIINAKSETICEKKTFKTAILQNRCLVPCSGWYEWLTENNKKQKYLFSSPDNIPLYMAGIYYPQHSGQSDKLVTLTTKPTTQCAAYHHRMPVIIALNEVSYWFDAKAQALEPLFEVEQSFLVTAC